VAEIRNQTSPVEVITEKGQKFICNKVLLAVPSGTMGKIKFGALS
jgi:monoamine oxidase